MSPFINTVKNEFVGLGCATQAEKLTYVYA